LQFNNKVILITGAGSGLGREMAVRFAEKGARLIVNDINEESIHQTLSKISSSDSIGFTGDVTDEKHVKEMVHEGIGKFGRIDILVNNAGIADLFIPTLEQDINDWQRIIDIHLRGSFLCSLHVGQNMIANQYGKIINIASIVGLGGFPSRNAYGAAKAGIIMFTRNIACEWAKYGINVNAVAPGYMMTPLVETIFSKDQVSYDKVRKRIPLGQLGDAGDIFNAVAFLASDESKYITGICLPVDGGWTAFGASGDAFEVN
jgi:NAD(P)-dependent dehydrogenase (short-subunit alcohol dehydrogenase family)